MRKLHNIYAGLFIKNWANASRFCLIVSRISPFRLQDEQAADGPHNVPCLKL